MPAFTALLADSARQIVSDVCPFHGTSSLYKRQDQFILFTAPWSFYKRWVEHFLPAMKTLDICAARQALSDLFPVLTVELLDSFGKLLVLFRGPVALVCSILILRWTGLVDVWVLSLTSADLGLSFSIVLFAQWRRWSE